MLIVYTHVHRLTTHCYNHKHACNHNRLIHITSQLRAPLHHNLPKVTSKSSEYQPKWHNQPSFFSQTPWIIINLISNFSISFNGPTQRSAIVRKESTQRRLFLKCPKAEIQRKRAKEIMDTRFLRGNTSSSTELKKPRPTSCRIFTHFTIQAKHTLQSNTPCYNL